MISPDELECSVRQWFGMGVGSPFGGVYPRRWCVDSRLSTPLLAFALALAHWGGLSHDTLVKSKGS